MIWGRPPWRLSELRISRGTAAVRAAPPPVPAQALRLIVYCGKAKSRGTAPPAEQRAAVAGAPDSDVTGRVTHQNGRFLLVAEGPEAAIAAIHAGIEAQDPCVRPAAMLDLREKYRFFPYWSDDSEAPDGLPAIDGARHRAIFDRVDAGGVMTRADGLRLLEVLSGVSQAWMDRALRVPPTQSRALITVDRLLDATHEVLTRVHVADLTVEAVAAEAGVSQQAAHRYFASAEDVLRAFTLRFQARRLHLLCVYAARTPFRNKLARLRAIVFLLLQNYAAALSEPGISRTTVLHLVRHLQHPSAVAHWQPAPHIAVMLHGRFGMPGGPVPAALERSILIGVFAAARTAFLHDPEGFLSGPVHAMLTGLLAGAFRAPRRADAPVPAGASVPGRDASGREDRANI